MQWRLALLKIGKISCLNCFFDEKNLHGNVTNLYKGVTKQFLNQFSQNVGASRINELPQLQIYLPYHFPSERQTDYLYISDAINISSCNKNAPVNC